MLLTLLTLVNFHFESLSHTFFLYHYNVMNNRDELVLEKIDEIVNEGDILNTSLKKYGNPKDYLEMTKIVFDFIKKKGLILYGGEAIDKNLKHIGKPGIYDENTKPDYDFYSSNYERDSIELCNIFFDKGYKYVARFPRIHRGTFGIRANTVNVADITYVPSNILEKIPRIKIDGVNYISSDFVLKNLYQGLIRPRLGANYSRWEKDFCRLQLFLQYFKTVQPKKTKGGAKLATSIGDTLKKIETKFVNGNPHIVITGQRAFQYYMEAKNESQIMFELISVNKLLEQHVAMVEKILEQDGGVKESNKLTKEVYSPFFNDLPMRVRLKLNGVPIVDFYDFDRECIAAVGQYVNYYFLMHFLYSQMFYTQVYPGTLESISGFHLQIEQLKEMRDKFLKSNKLTGFEAKAGKFQVFTNECIGIQKTDPEITFEQQKAGIEQYPRYYPEFEYVDLKKFKSKIVPPKYDGALVKSGGKRAKK